MAFRARNVLGTFEKRFRGPRTSRTVHDQLGEPIYYYIVFFLFVPDIFHPRVGLVGLTRLPYRSTCDQRSRTPVMPRRVVLELREHPTGIATQRERRDRCLILWVIYVVDLCQGFL